MPDHLYLVWMGLRPDSDQPKGMAFLRTYLEPDLSPVKFQPQPHDSVLRQPERETQRVRESLFLHSGQPGRGQTCDAAGRMEV